MLVPRRLWKPVLIDPMTLLCFIICSFLQNLLFLHFVCSLWASTHFLEAGKALTPRTSLHTSLLREERSSLGEESNAKNNNPQKKSCTRATCLETEILQPMVCYWEKQQRVFFLSNVQNCFGEPGRVVRQLGMPAAGLCGGTLILGGAGVPDPHPSRKLLDIFHHKRSPAITWFICRRLTRTRYLANPSLSLTPWASSSLL